MMATFLVALTHSVCLILVRRTSSFEPHRNCNILSPAIILVLNWNQNVLALTKAWALAWSHEQRTTSISPRLYRTSMQSMEMPQRESSCSADTAGSFERRFLRVFVVWLLFTLRNLSSSLFLQPVCWIFVSLPSTASSKEGFTIKERRAKASVILDG